jgi:hypothetical protein
MKIREPAINIQLQGWVFNLKIVRRIAFQYWITFPVAREGECWISNLAPPKDFLSMFIMIFKMRSATQTESAPIEKNSICSIIM